MFIAIQWIAQTRPWGHLTVSIDAVTRIIQLVLAPVVMISACAIVLNGIIARYESLSNRVRTLIGERIEILRAAKERDVWTDILIERLNEIDTQMPRLMERHRRMRDSVLALYCAIGVFIFDMFAIAGAAQTGEAGPATAALLFFFAGIVLVFIGVVFASMEVRVSQIALQYEVERLTRFAETLRPPEPKP